MNKKGVYRKGDILRVSRGSSAPGRHKGCLSRIPQRLPMLCATSALPKKSEWQQPTTELKPKPFRILTPSFLLVPVMEEEIQGGTNYAPTLVANPFTTS